jgi:restriction system protein
MTVLFPDSNTLEASVLKALKANGGTATTEQIDKFVGEDLALTPDQMTQIRSGKRTEIQYRLAWVRTKAKNRGLIEKSGNRMWNLSGQN